MAGQSDLRKLLPDLLPLATSLPPRSGVRGGRASGSDFEMPSGLLDMEFSGPATLAMVKEDLRMSDDDVVGTQIPPGTTERPALPDVLGSATPAPTSAKRILGDLNLSEEFLAPA